MWDKTFQDCKIFGLTDAVELGAVDFNSMDPDSNNLCEVMSSFAGPDELVEGRVRADDWSRGLRSLDDCWSSSEPIVANLWESLVLWNNEQDPKTTCLTFPVVPLDSIHHFVLDRFCDMVSKGRP
jgi:hypothetical protein